MVLSPSTKTHISADYSVYTHHNLFYNDINVVNKMNNTIEATYQSFFDVDYPPCLIFYPLRFQNQFEVCLDFWS